jgi:hypothetical protein
LASGGGKLRITTIGAASRAMHEYHCWLVFYWRILRDRSDAPRPTSVRGIFSPVKFTGLEFSHANSLART